MLGETGRIAWVDRTNSLSAYFPKLISVNAVMLSADTIAI